MTQQNPNEQFPSVVTPGMVASQQFGTQSVQKTGDVGQGSMTAHVQAAVQAKYVMAERRPRDEETVRAKLLRDCQRPSFAATATYHVPKKGPPGLTIRFAEAAARAMGNIWCETFTVFEDAHKRLTRIRVVDLETNTTHERDINVEKVVERRQPGTRGQVGQRVNSEGRVVFLVKATEDELLGKESSLASKALRNLILKMVPGWLQDECKEAVLLTQRKEDAKDPDASKRRILDRFSQLNVMPADLVKYLGHAVDHCTPTEMDNLRGIYAAVRDGECSWADILAAKLGERGEEGGASKSQSRSDEVLDKLSSEKERRG